MSPGKLKSYRSDSGLSHKIDEKVSRIPQCNPAAAVTDVAKKFQIISRKEQSVTQVQIFDKDNECP